MYQMTLGRYMFGQFSALQYLEFVLRLVIGCVCGAIIGFERSKRFKEAGIRTHIIVCCAASLMMIISKYGFADMSSELGRSINDMKGTDPARIAAQVVSGVSFLGAGIIFRNGSSIRGLTTAAGIWATAGIGLAIGAGMYVVGAVATILIAVMQVIMHKIHTGIESSIDGHIHFTVTDPKSFRPTLINFITQNKMQITTSKVAYNKDGSATFDLSLRMPANSTLGELAAFLDSYSGIREIICELENR